MDRRGGALPGVTLNEDTFAVTQILEDGRGLAWNRQFPELAAQLGHIVVGVNAAWRFKTDEELKNNMFVKIYLVKAVVQFGSRVFFFDDLPGPATLRKQGHLCVHGYKRYLCVRGL